MLTATLLTILSAAQLSTQQNERVPAEFRVTFAVDTTVRRDSLSALNARIHRTVTIKTSLHPETRATNPLGVIKAVPPIDPALYAQLRKLMIKQNMEYDKALELCAGEQACNRALGDLMNEHVETFVRKKPAAQAAPSSQGFVVYTRDPAAPCTVEINVSERISDNDVKGSYAWTQLSQAHSDTIPALKAFCDVVVAFDRAGRVHHIDFPSRAVFSWNAESTHSEKGVIRREQTRVTVNDAPASQPLRMVNLPTPDWFPDKKSGRGMRYQLTPSREFHGFFTKQVGKYRPETVRLAAGVLAMIDFTPKRDAPVAVAPVEEPDKRTTTLQAKLDRLLAVFSSAPALESPSGFTVESSSRVNVTEDKHPSTATLSIQLPAQPEDFGNFLISINDPETLLLNNDNRDTGYDLGQFNQGAVRFLERYAIAPLQLRKTGNVIEYENGVMVMADGVSPWTAVTQEEFINNLIAILEREIGTNTGNLRVEESRYRREKDADPRPSSADQYIVMLRRQIAATNEASSKWIDALKAELAALSPSERKAAAHYIGADLIPRDEKFSYESRSDRASGLAEAGAKAPGYSGTILARPLVRVNPTWYDAKLSKQTAQLISVMRIINTANTRSEATLKQILEQTDWNAVARVLQ